MRVAFLYECRYRNDGPPLFLKENFVRSIGSFDIESVNHYIPEGNPDRWGKIDLFIWVDHGEDSLQVDPFDVSILDGTTVYWCSDSHIGLEYRLEKAREFDIVFVTISDHVDVFKKALGHERVYWLPHAGEHTAYFYKDVIKRTDVCFIGHLPNEERIDLLDTLFKEFPEFYYGNDFFEAASSRYNESKIVFNHSIAGEANMRVFEGTLSGSMLLTSYSKDVEKMGYIDGEHLVFYHNSKDMIDKARFFIDHDQEREEIALRGMNFTLKNNTYNSRVKIICAQSKHCITHIK